MSGEGDANERRIREAELAGVIRRDEFGPERPAETLFAGMVRRELERARAKHPPINSHHEGYGVVLEELDEFWDLVKAYRGSRWDEDHRAEWRDQVLHELVQVGAMAQRVAEDCS